MKICNVADLHLIYNDPFGKMVKQGSESINSRLKDKLDFLKFSVQTAIKNDCAVFVCNGDMFDTSNPSRNLKSMFFAALYPLFQEGITVIFIMGNHEISKSGKHVFFDFEKIPKNLFFIVDRKFTTTLDDRDVVFLPSGVTEDVIKDIEADICFGHFPIVGEFMNDSHRSKTGINAKVLKNKFKLIRLGHFHKRSEFYTGALAKRSFSEKSYDPCFEIIDTKDLSVVSYPVYDRNLVEVVIDKDNTELEVVSSTDDIVKVKIKGSKSFIESVKYSRIWDGIPCHKLLPIETEITDSEDKKEKTASIINIEELIPEYAKENEESSLSKFGLELWKKYANS
jgi:DNA repair exonuclease SbcCD nuclease subunit